MATLPQSNSFYANGEKQPSSKVVDPWSKTAAAFDKVLTPGTLMCSAKTVEMVEQLCPITPDSNVLDIGAGTGSITRTVRQKYPDTRIMATDSAPGMVANLDQQNIPGVVTAVADGRNLDRNLIPDGSFTHALAGLMIQFCGDEQISVCRELYRALVPGGAAAVSISYNVDIPEPWHRACERVDSSRYTRVPLHEPKAWMTTERVKEAMQSVGFVDVQDAQVYMRGNIGSVDEYLDYWLNSKHPLFAKMIAAWQGDLSEVLPTLKSILEKEYTMPMELGGMSGIVAGKKLS